MSVWERGDWFVFFNMNAVMASATVYVFLHPDAVTFGEWCALVGTVISGYHWLLIRDSKTPDAQPTDAH